MGLDMYLERMPRIDGIRPENIRAYESWIDYNDYLVKPLANGEKAKCSFEEWSPYMRDYLPTEEKMEMLKPYYGVKYWLWDTDHEYGRSMVMEEVGYWRKVNAIHNWFVNTVQDGEDDCNYHKEVTPEILESLKALCKEVLATGDGSLLPTRSGFFFGDTEYDEWYFEGIRETIEMIDNILATTDFDKQMVFYCSSW